jgi:hypothetical protein
MTGHPPFRNLALSRPVTVTSSVPPSARRGQLTGPDGPVSARVTQSATIEANSSGTSSQAK